MHLFRTLKNTWEDALDPELRLQIIVMAGAILALTFLEPFGMAAMSVWAQLFYWCVCIPAGFVGAWMFNRWLRPVFIRRGLSRWTAPFLIASITAAAMASVLIMEAVLREPIPLRYLALLASYVAGLSVVIWGVMMLGLGPGVSDDAQASDPAFEAFRTTWPPELREAELKALSAEDHYIRLHTSAGDALLAGRFSEAMEAVARRPGTQVHRSWWVAESAPQTLSRKGGKWELVLGDDLHVPVSRRFRPDVRAKGWDRLGQ